MRRDCPGIAETVNPASAVQTQRVKTAKAGRQANTPACPFLVAAAIVPAVARARFGLDSHGQFTTGDMKAGDGNRRAVWIGPTGSEEFELARGVLASRLETIVVGENAWQEEGRSDPRGPLLACLAADGPRRAVHETALRLARRWPLCRFVAISSSLCEGRRRSGPPTPGVEEIPWHELPGRLDCWLEDVEAGRPGWLGQPPTLRREERLLVGVREGAAAADEAANRRTVAVAAARSESLDGLVSLLTSFRVPADSAAVGRPTIDASADVLLWECEESVSAELPWLGILAAHRPETDIVLIESFPRGDRTVEAIGAGAAWVLARPTSGDVLLGTLRWLARKGRRSGLGGPAAGG